MNPQQPMNPQPGKPKQDDPKELEKQKPNLFYVGMRKDIPRGTPPSPQKTGGEGFSLPTPSQSQLPAKQTFFVSPNRQNIPPASRQEAVLQPKAAPPHSFIPQRTDPKAPIPPQPLSTSLPNPVHSHPSPPLASKSRTEVPKNMDFESFRKHKISQEKEKLEEKAGPKKASQERYQLKKGMGGAGKKYKDHKIGRGIAERPKDPSCGKGTRYQDHRLAESISDILPEDAGEGAKYQDHRLGNALNSPHHPTAGEGSKYQDHRLDRPFEGEKPPAQGERYQDHKRGGISASAAAPKKKFNFKKT